MSDKNPYEDRGLNAGSVLNQLEAIDADREVKQEMRRMSRRSFIWAGIAAVGVYEFVGWLASRHEDLGTPWPFRRALDANEDLAMDYFGPKRLAPTFSKSDLTLEDVDGQVGIRSNGAYGIDDDPDFDPKAWTLTVNNVFGKDKPVQLTMEDLKKLPSTTQITEMFCIEGWSIKVEWKGIRFVDFAEKYPPNPRVFEKADGSDKPAVRSKPQNLVRFVSMKTPNEAYYVGLDMASALHPQTLLCYEMNGAPLTDDHGAPLRLAIPVKYGVKNLKRIGSITYTDEKPADYWAEQGYDWYAGM